MGRTHRVTTGEHLSQIAKKYGVLPESIWDDPGNSQLRASRKTSQLLYPGDRLVIPDKREKSVPAATTQRHRFVQKIPRDKIRLVIRDELGEPLSGVDYELSVPGQDTLADTTGSDGLIQCEVPTGTERAELRYLGRAIQLKLGGLDPGTSVRGIQERMTNLGFDCGPIDGLMGPRTRSGIVRFQRSRGLKVTGRPDQDLVDALEQAHEGKKWSSESIDIAGQGSVVSTDLADPEEEEEDEEGGEDEEGWALLGLRRDYADEDD